MRLSHRPTDCERDDDPVDIRALLKPENNEEPIRDWPAYLKEGWDKFRLPSVSILQFLNFSNSILVGKR